MCPPSGTHPLHDNHTRSDDESRVIPPYVPNDQISQSAYQIARRSLHPAILRHSLRVFLYAKLISEQTASPWHQAGRLPQLFTAAVFHDIGTSASHDGPQRFEVEGGDAAVAFLTAAGHHGAVSAADAHEVWTAIALHTSPGIAERITVLAHVVRAAVQADFHRDAAGDGYAVPAPVRAETEALLPRGDIEKILGDVVAEQAVRQPEKGPKSSWPGGLRDFRLENPGWEWVNGAFDN